MFRTELGMTQEQLAKAIQSTQSTIHLWESGKTDVSGYYLLKLSKALNATTDELLGAEFVPPRSNNAIQIQAMLNDMTEEEQNFCIKLIAFFQKNKHELYNNKE